MIACRTAISIEIATQTRRIIASRAVVVIAVLTRCPIITIRTVVAITVQIHIRSVSLIRHEDTVAIGSADESHTV